MGVDAGGALKRWLALAAALLLPACGSHQLDLEALSSASDQIVWEAGQKAVEKKDWASARQYFRRLIDAFPQSEHQPDSRIALADSYFEEGGTANYVLAVSSYREFLTLYPQSSWVEPARERVHECRQSLARAHFSVGYFYQKTRQAWRSAIGRYETIVTDYPDFEKIDEVLYRLGECLGNAGRYAEARPHLARLQAEFPESPFVELAKKLEATFPSSGVAPAETPPAGPKVTPKETPAPAAPNAPPPSSERPQVSL